jgi:hypothetical protein
MPQDTHETARKTGLDMELRLHHTMGFDKSHIGVHREILCHCRVGVELDGGQVVTLRFVHGIFH